MVDFSSFKTPREGGRWKLKGWDVPGDDFVGRMLVYKDFGRFSLLCVFGGKLEWCMFFDVFFLNMRILKSNGPRYPT